MEERDLKNNLLSSYCLEISSFPSPSERPKQVALLKLPTEAISQDQTNC